MNRKTRELLNIILGINIVYAISVMFIGKIEDSQFRIFVFAALYLMLPVVNILLVLAIYMSQNVIIIEKKEEEKITLPSLNEFDLLSAIRSIILDRGERFPKKHGTWICLNLQDEFFSMDSWNGAIQYHTGEPVYEYWTGFSGSSHVYLGLSDKSWRHNDPLPLSKEEYANYLNKLTMFVNEHIKKEHNESL